MKKILSYFVNFFYKFIITENIRKIININKIFLKKYGFYNSIVNQFPCDSNKNSLPWYTYSSIEYLNNIDFSNCSIFEWGSGSSSIYWSTKANNVVSVEHDQLWFKKLVIRKKNNMTILLKKSKKEYVEVLKESNKKYNVIIIDGEYRLDCCKNDLMNYLADGGIIILDNSDWFPKSCKILRSKGLLQVDFSGFGPLNDYTWTTSIFFSSLRSKSFKKDKCIIGNIEQNAEII